MRPLRPLLAACLLAPSAGCESFREWMRRPVQPANTGAVPKVSADQLVGYLNAHAGRLQNITYGDVIVSATEGDGLRGAVKGLVFPTLHGYMAASQPRNFRMKVGANATAQFDFGSNDQQFWVYFDVPATPKAFVYASHTDFESGKAGLPGGIPFEPDWVMQALGMTTFPPNPPYTAETDEKARTHTLSWPATTPGGAQVRKEIVFAADDAVAAREQPQVRRHLIRDGRDPKNLKGKVICTAEVRAARTVAAGGAGPDGRPLTLQYPTEIELRWEEQKFRMTLKLDAARVNEQIPARDAAARFERPNIAGVPAVDLAHARFDAPGK